MPQMPKIIKNCELPIGTLVQVHERREDRLFKAIVRGYDIHHTKFEVGRQYMGDRYADGGTWAFPSEIVGYRLPNDDEWWAPDPMPEPPEPMPWGEYTHLADQPVEACHTVLPSHIYGEPEKRVIRGILRYPSDGGHHWVAHFYGHASERFAWESVRALDYAELTKQELIDWMATDPQAALRFAFDAMWSERKVEILNKDSEERLQALADKAEAERERREDARQAAIEDMRH